ncbi:FAD-dependent oxidoreductase [bacterium]|nr:FAD-dependent oxidoreductase [bacterium]
MSDGNRVVVIGGDAAGLKAAARLKRICPETTITVFERSETISYAACGLPYYLSGDIDSLDDLLTTAWGEKKTPDYFLSSKDIEVKTGHQVIGIYPEKKQVEVRRTGADSSRAVAYDSLIIATGASPIMLDLPGCSGDGVCCFTRPSDAVNLRQSLERNEIGRVLVVGAGYIGLELCEAFGALWGVEVVLVERENQVLAPNLDPELARLVQNHLEDQGVTMRLGARLERVKHNENQLVAVLDDGSEEPVDRVIVCVGVRPNARLAFEAGLTLGYHGGILINEQGQTSDPSIYAAGDCAELPDGQGTRLLPLGSIANRMGRVVANSIAGIAGPGLAPPNGAGIVKVFDLTVGSIGTSANRAVLGGNSVEEYWGTFSANAHYYPESTDVFMKLIRAADGRLLGLQVVGQGDVTRWVNGFGQILDLTEGNTEALTRYEHAYAPPYATALDPFHHFAGMIEAGADLQYSPEAWEELAVDPSITWINLLDDSERSSVTLPSFAGTVHDWTLGEVRKSLATLPKNKVIVFCAKGPRSYEAALFLRQQGINARYMAGGVLMLG